MLDSLSFGDYQLNDGRSKIALIDSGNSTIQVPYDVFNRLGAEMKKIEKSIYNDHIEGRKILIARRSCKDLYDVFMDLTFDVDGTKIVIKPQGYLYRYGS